MTELRITIFQNTGRIEVVRAEDGRIVCAIEAPLIHAVNDAALGALIRAWLVHFGVTE